MLALPGDFINKLPDKKGTSTKGYFDLTRKEQGLYPPATLSLLTGN